MTAKKTAKPKAGPKTRAPDKAPKEKAKPKPKAAKAQSLAARPKLKAAPKPKAGKASPAKRKPAVKKAAPAQAAAVLTPDTLRQVAALPLRQAGDDVEVLLITSRETHRWVIPKGWPMRKMSDADAAATEALEEAGLLGAVGAEPLGAFSYFKRREEHFDLVDVAVYRFDVSGQEEAWREKDQRELRWCGLEEAARLVQEPGLKLLLRELAARL